MTYATSAEIQAVIPFTLDANSMPTLTRAGVVQELMHEFIKKYTGTTLSSDDGLKLVEVELTAQRIMNMHKGDDTCVVTLSRELRIILDNYFPTKSVSFKVFEDDD